MPTEKDKPKARTAPKKTTAKTAPKVMDVAKPGKTTPAATSKPIIVGHKVMKDPMVSTTTDKDGNSAEVPTAPLPRSGKIIKPISITDDGELKQSPDIPHQDDSQVAVIKEPQAQTAPPVTSAVTVDEQPTPPEPEAAASPKETPSPPAETEAPPAEEATDESKTAASVDTAVVDAVADQAVSKKKQESKETEEEKQRRENIEKLIAEKKYFVPVGQVTKKRRTRWTLVIVLLLFLALGGYVAVDALTDIKLPYEYFKKQSPAATMSTEEPAALKTYGNQKLGLAFKYPATWTVSEAKDTDRVGIDIVRIKSPQTDIMTHYDDKKEKVAAYLEIKIYVEHTADKNKYPSGAQNLGACIQEPFRLTSEPALENYLTFVNDGDPAKQTGGVHQTLLAQSKCASQPSGLGVNDQFQFASKKNTYVVYGGYYLTSESYKKFASGSGAQQIPEHLLATTPLYIHKDAFTAPAVYKEALVMQKSLQSL